MWYDKFLSIYGKPFDEVEAEIIDATNNRLKGLQSDEPLASIVVIAYNEEPHLQACLWSLSELVCSYPVEIIGVDNDSDDRTAEIFEKSGITYYKEYRHSCGYARLCGLQHARGKYYIDVDADTLYPSHYFEIMIKHLMLPKVVCVSATWGYFPTENNSALGLRLYEMTRNLFLWIQHFKRPELSVRGLVFAYNAELGRKVSYRVDIIRGEDGSMALALKKYGKIKFVYDTRCKAITGYGSMQYGSLWHNLCMKAKYQAKGIFRIFYSKDHYEDEESNLVNNQHRRVDR